MNNKRGIWKYDAWLPSIPEACRVTLGEGQTPLVCSNKLGKELGLDRLYFKLESSNPTGSYKDRIAAMCVSHALAQGKPACVGTSSGNAGASTAAYAARAGLPYHLLVLEQIAEAKLLQAAAYGALITRIKDFGNSAEVGNRVFEYIVRQSELHNWEMTITAYAYSPVAMEGAKTISYELFDDLERQPVDAVFVPVGGGGLFTAVSRGFDDLERLHSDYRKPSLVAVQSEGCSHIVRAWQEGLRDPLPGDSTSRISGLQVPDPPDGERVLSVLNGGGGWGEQVADETVWAWQERLASTEGILCEPAAAVSLAGVEKALRSGHLKEGSSVICLLTGAGFKDSDRLKRITEGKAAVPVCDIKEL